jgi:hypothetical protein
MENSGVFYSHLEYFTGIWYILRQCGNVVVIWYIFPRFLVYCVMKNLATLDWVESSLEISIGIFRISQS